MASLGLFFASFSILMPLTLFGLLVVVVVGVTTARNEPDPHHHRLPATYLTAVSFVLVFTLLFAGTVAVGSLTSLIEDDDDVEFTTLREEGFDAADDDGDTEAAVSGAVAALLAAGVAGGLLWHYRRTLLDLIEADGFREHAGARVVHAYLYAVQFVAVLVLVGAAAVSLYGLAQVVMPGILSASDPDDVRQSGARLFLTAGALAAGAAGLAVLHMREHGRLESRPTPPSVI